jgi:phosphate starvation-inducible protein PhoH and related proteins
LTKATLDVSLEPIDNPTLAVVCGALDANLRAIEQAFDVKIARRMARFTVTGDAEARTAAKRALERFRYMASHGSRDITDEDVALTFVELKVSAKPAPAAALLAPVAPLAPQIPQAPSPPFEISTDDAPLRPIELKVKRTDLTARTPMQQTYLQNIAQYDITFGIGPAGTGKTYLAVACAVDAFERELIKRIVLVRPAVEAGERLGFLPGDLIQKVDPYLRPLYDALFDLMGLEKTTKLMERGTIEVAPLAFMRGRTLNGAFIILDEAQNTTPEQMKMFLTRIGFGTKTVVTGDPTQVDLQKNQKSGLMDAHRVLSGTPGIAFTRFTSVDVVRHPLVQKIVNAYEREAATEK